MGLTRSEQMARIRGLDTAPEVMLRRALWKVGVRYRLRLATPGGRPDIVIRSSGPLAIFVDGCFFHGCPLHYVPPRSRIGFWASKLTENVGRDQRQTLALECQGWRVLRFWEHEVFESLEEAVARVQAALGDEHQADEQSWRVFRIEWLDSARVLERRWLQDLRDPTRVRSEERRRQTTKARAPRPKRAPLSPVHATVRRR